MENGPSQNGGSGHTTDQDVHAVQSAQSSGEGVHCTGTRLGGMPVFTFVFGGEDIDERRRSML